MNKRLQIQSVHYLATHIGASDWCSEAVCPSIFIHNPDICTSQESNAGCTILKPGVPPGCTKISGYISGVSPGADVPLHCTKAISYKR